MNDAANCMHRQFSESQSYCPDCGLSRSEVLVATCEPFLKDGETPAECIARNRRDVDGCLTMLIAERRKAEVLAARLAEIIGYCAQEGHDGEPYDTINAIATGAYSTRGGGTDSAPAVEQRLWLWRNGDHFLAFEHLYPCFTPGGDPMTLGEPVGYAIVKRSFDRAAGSAKAAVCEACGGTGKAYLLYSRAERPCPMCQPDQPTHVHSAECWEPDSGCDIGRNEKFAVAVQPPAVDYECSCGHKWHGPLNMNCPQCNPSTPETVDARNG